MSVKNIFEILSDLPRLSLCFNLVNHVIEINWVNYFTITITITITIALGGKNPITTARKFVTNYNYPSLMVTLPPRALVELLSSEFCKWVGCRWAKIMHL